MPYHETESVGLLVDIRSPGSVECFCRVLEKLGKTPNEIQTILAGYRREYEELQAADSKPT